MNKIRDWLGAPVSGASLGAFRIGFGAVQLYQTWEFIRPLEGVSTLVHLYTGADRHWNFPYPGFEWVRPMPEPWTSIIFAFLGLTSLLVTIGFFSRTSSFVNGLLFTYAWMLEQTWWNNHYYLSSLICLMLALTPCGECFSVDRYLRCRRSGTGTQWDGFVPFWSVFWFRAQLYIVYTYAAVVKMNSDWLSGEPPRMWFRGQLVGKPMSWVLPPDTMHQIFSVMGTEFMVYLLVWGGLIFDLFVGLMLCIRRTQVLAIVLMVIFHGTNFCLFMIGAFPVMAVSSTLIFLDPDWPIRLGQWVRRPTFRAPDPGWMLLGMFLVPIVGAVLGWKIPRSPTRADAPPSFPIPSAIPIALGIWILVQALLPLRHLTIPGDVHWTLEGSRFSWQVMARVHVGQIHYRIYDPAWDDLPDATNVAFPPFDENTNDRKFQEIDSFHLDPSTLPEIVVFSDPWVRERIFYNPAVRGLTSRAEIEDRIQKIWRERYGRTPLAVAPSRTVREICKSLEQHLQNRRPAYPLEPLRRALVACRQIPEIVEQIAPLADDDPSCLEKVYDAQMLLTNLRQATVDMGAQGEFLNRWIQIRPLELQSGRGLEWMQIIDPKLIETRVDPKTHEGDRSTLRWDLWAGAPIIHVDLLRTHSFLHHLWPRMLVGWDRTGKPMAQWNAVRDLRGIQLEGHIPAGVMIHQYANGRIARLWQEETGRRPRVIAHAFSKLNQHPMQRLIDPTVDLASVPLKLWSHNEWILPQRYRNVIYHEHGRPYMKLVTVGATSPSSAPSSPVGLGKETP